MTTMPQGLVLRDGAVELADLREGHRRNDRSIV